MNMARELSKLQKFILSEAYKAAGSMTNQRLLRTYYGFEPAEKYRRSYKIYFDVRQIGRDRYNAASVAVVKAFNRLVARGLARRAYNHGIYLTNAGRGLAKQTLIGGSANSRS